MRRVALVLVGLVLLVAGIAKMAAFARPVDSLGWPLELVVAGSAVELLLGLWLLSGAAIRAAHLTTIGIFLLFAVLSAYQVIRGVPSCGCLGKLYVHPAWMLTFDLVTLGVLASLWFAERRRPAPSPGTEPTVDRGILSYVLSASVVCGIAAVALLAAGWTFAGSFEGTLGVANGRSVLLSPSTIDLGNGTVGETKRATVRIVNASATPVRLIGGKNNCSCMVTRQLPLEVAAGGSAELPIDVFLKAEGSREIAFVLFTDHPEAETLSGRVRFHGDPVPLSSEGEESSHLRAARSTAIADR